MNHPSVELDMTEMTDRVLSYVEFVFGYSVRKDSRAFGSALFTAWARELTFRELSRYLSSNADCKYAQLFFVFTYLSNKEGISFGGLNE